MTSIGIHQPNFMPWLGYFRKIHQSDVFIFLNTVKCSKNSYLNRNKFSTSKKFNDYFWLTCPLKKESYKKDILNVDTNSSFIRKHINYFKMRHSKTKETQYLQEVIKTYELFSSLKDFKISEFNIDIIKLTCRFLDIKTNFLESSLINHDRTKSKQFLIVDLVKATNGNKYISGDGAKAYQDESLFLSEGIEILYPKNRKDELIKIKNENISVTDLILHFGIEECRKMILA